MDATDNTHHEYWTNETHEINPASTDSLQDAGLHDRELQRQPRKESPLDGPHAARWSLLITVGLVADDDEAADV